MVLKFGHLRKVDQKHLESFGMCCWRRMEKISWTDCVRKEEFLHRVKEERNIVHTVKRRKANWIGHILCRNCALKRIIEGKEEKGIEATGRQGIRRKQQLDNLNETKGYWKLKEEALDSTVWSTSFRRGYGPVVRQNAEWKKERNKGRKKERKKERKKGVNETRGAFCCCLVIWNFSVTDSV